MCGIAGWTGEPPASLVAAAVHGAGRRGPHTHGVVSWRGAGWALHHRGLGRLPHTGLVTGALIAHSRLATSTQAPGDIPPVEETMPYLLDGWSLAHNGNVSATGLAELHARCETFGVREPESPQVDSMTLLVYLAGILSKWGVESAVSRLGEDLQLLTQCPHAILVGSPDGRVFVLRASGSKQLPHPVYVARGDGWAIASSGPLPGGRLAPEGVTPL